MPPRERRDFTVVIFLATLAAWNLVQCSLINKPPKSMGGDAWITQQIGRVARNHLVLGLGRTKGANVACLAYDGTLRLHASYSPLASWTVAVPMALGVPFRTSAKAVTILSMNVFFVSLWYALRQQCGPCVASFGAAYAAMFPATLWEYGQTSVFEILGLGPTFLAVALFSQPKRTTGIWLAIAVASILAVMYSWFDLLIVGPFASREFVVRRDRKGLVVVVLALVVPIAVSFATVVVASGDTELIRRFLSHALDRTGSLGDRGEIIRFTQLAYMLAARWKGSLGAFALCATALWLVYRVIDSRKAELGFLTAVLLAYALPLNLFMKNAAYHHPFFIIMFVPLAAIALAQVSWNFLRSMGTPPGRMPLAMALVFIAFLYCDVWIARSVAKRDNFDTRLAAIGDEVGRIVRLGDFVIAGPSFFYSPFLPDGSRCPADLKSRHERVNFGYFGQMTQAAVVVYDAADAANLLKLARPDQRVVVLLQEQEKVDYKPGDEPIRPVGPEIEDHIWDITRFGFRPVPSAIEDFLIGVQEARLIRPVPAG
jgi:hypothetical protein